MFLCEWAGDQEIFGGTEKILRESLGRSRKVQISGTTCIISKWSHRLRIYNPPFDTISYDWKNNIYDSQMWAPLRLPLQRLNFRIASSTANRSQGDGPWLWWTRERVRYWWSLSPGLEFCPSIEVKGRGSYLNQLKFYLIEIVWETFLHKLFSLLFSRQTLLFRDPCDRQSRGYRRQLSLCGQGNAKEKVPKVLLVRGQGKVRESFF